MDSAHEGSDSSPSKPKDLNIGLLQYELDYRRHKQESIFSWGSAILVTIIGGILLLSRDPTHPIKPAQKLFISGAIVGLSFFAFVWLSYNASRESVTATELEQLTGKQLRDKKGDESSEHTASIYIGYRVALVLLAVAALFATWYWT
jgi:hypothetical protein